MTIFSNFIAIFSVVTVFWMLITAICLLQDRDLFLKESRRDVFFDFLNFSKWMIIGISVGLTIAHYYGG